MGLFVILAAILTKVFNLSNIWDPSYMLWYTREASVAVYVSNLPMIWPLLREWFPSLKSISPGQKSTNSGSKRTGLGYVNGTNGRPRTTTIAGRHISGTFGGKRLSDGNGNTGITTTIHGKGESTEELSGSDDTEMGVFDKRQDSWELQRTGTAGGHGHGNSVWETSLGKENGIHMVTTVQVSEEHIEEGIVSPRDVLNSPRDLEKGGKVFEWGFGPK